MATQITTTQIVSEFGQYYENAGQNSNRLKADLTQPSETIQKYTHRVKTNDTIYKAGNFTRQKLVQPFSKIFNANGGVTFYPNEIRLRQMKVDLSLYPSDIEDAWLGFLAGKDSKEFKSWPIVKWLLEEYVAKQVQEDIELDAIYNGVYDAQGTTPGTTMDGLKKKLQEGATADYSINTVEGIGNLSAETIFDQIEAFDKAIPAMYQQMPLCIFVSPTWLRAYLEAKRENGFYQITGDSQINAHIDFTNHKVVGLPSMANSDDMFATFTSNIACLSKRDINSTNIRIEEYHREVSILADWWMGIGFDCNKFVWATSETVSTNADGEQGNQGNQGTQGNQGAQGTQG